MEIVRRPIFGTDTPRSDPFRLVEAITGGCPKFRIVLLLSK
jgi:hypothetical protein